MLVGKRMTKEPVTTTPDEYLAGVMAKMEQGGFRHMPVVQGGKLLGIVTDRDARQHIGFLEKTKVNAAMTENAVTVTPQATLEEAAQLLLKRKIDLFSLDALVNMVARAGMQVKLTVRKAA